MMETIQHILEHNELKNTPTSYLVRTFPFLFYVMTFFLHVMGSSCRLSYPPGPTSAPTKSCEKASGSPWRSAAGGQQAPADGAG